MALKNKHIGLGRGLNAIFDIESQQDNKRATAAANEIEVPDSVVELELSKIDPNPGQPRVNFEQGAIDELAQSIRTLGIIQPLTVREGDYGRYIIISGERRFKAARQVGLKTVPVYVRTVDDQVLLEMALVENIQREDLNPIEIARSLDRLMTECQITQEKLSERVGKNRATISNYIRLLRLPARVQLAISHGEISMGHAKALLSIESDEVQEIIMERILKESLSVRQTEMAIKQFLKNGDAEKDKKVKSKSDVEQIKKYATTMSDFFGKKVSIAQTPKGESRVVITFKNEKELEEAISKLK